jgi:hypothetical protein
MNRIRRIKKDKELLFGEIIFSLFIKLYDPERLRKASPAKISIVSVPQHSGTIFELAFPS